MVDEGQRYDFTDGRVERTIDLDLFVLCEFSDEREGVVGLGVHEGVNALVDEIEKAARGPHVAFIGVLLVFKLLWGGIDGGAFVKGKVVDLGYFSVIDASGTAEICYFDDHALSDQDILWFEVPMEYSLNAHHDEGLYDLLEDS